MEVADIKKCSWNPRSMGRKTKKALQASINEFDDIAGITVNKRDGNIISGNHRFQELCDKYGKKNLKLKHAVGEFFGLFFKETFTNYVVRVVDWDETKVKAANITANNPLVSGEFTSGLQLQLEEISVNMPKELTEGLRIADLIIDVSIDSELSLDLDADRKHSEEANVMLDDSSTPEMEEVKEIRSLIKVSVPEEIRDEVKSDLFEYLGNKAYYKDIFVT